MDNDVRYFFFEPLDGELYTFDTEEERDEALEEVMDDCRTWDGEWDVDTLNDIEVGELRSNKKLKKINVIKRPEEIDEDGYDKDGNFWEDDMTEKCDYVFVFEK